jgi:type II secretory pathway component PulJ
MPVTTAEALEFDCPFCKAPRGAMCVYTAPYGKIGGQYVAGQPCRRVHWQRRGKARTARWQQRHRDSRPVTPASPEARAASAALRQFDLAEYRKLRDWLRDWGWLLTEANLPRRPDGTLRGDSYASGPRGS